MTARCLETRRTPEGFRRRRYEQDGVRFTTIEVPVEVWRAVARPDRIARALAGRENAAAQARRRALGEHLLAQGWKPAAVANELNVSEAAVRQWRQSMTP